MTGEAREPNKADLRIAEEGYFRFLSGVAILHNPFATKGRVHNSYLPRRPRSIERKLSKVEPLIVHAEISLIYEGLRDAIRYAHPERGKGSGLTRLEGRFESAVPFMQNVVDAVFGEERYHDRLARLDIELLETLRPAPMLDETLYGFLCRPRLDAARFTSRFTSSST
jgi:hypothetical protein